MLVVLLHSSLSVFGRICSKAASVCLLSQSSGVFQSPHWHWLGSRRTRTYPTLCLKKPVASGRAAPWLSRVLCHTVQVSPSDITESSVWESTHASLTSLFFAPIPHLALLLRPTCRSLLRCTLSCIFYSCFMFLAEGQEQVGTLALPIINKKYQHPSGCRVYLLATPQSQYWSRSTETVKVFLRHILTFTRVTFITPVQAHASFSRNPAISNLGHRRWSSVAFSIPWIGWI